MDKTRLTHDALTHHTTSHLDPDGVCFKPLPVLFAILGMNLGGHGVATEIIGVGGTPFA